MSVPLPVKVTVIPVALPNVDSVKGVTSTGIVPVTVTTCALSLPPDLMPFIAAPQLASLFTVQEVDSAGAPGSMTMESAFVPLPAALAALTVKLDVPAVVGVPEMAPAESVKPPGNTPVSMLHVIGVVPVAVNVWLYAVPTVPPGNAVVVIVGEVPPP